MQGGGGNRFFQPKLQQALRPWLLIVLALVAVRISKGAGFADLYGIVSRPFWPGSAQGEWIRSAQRLGDQSRLLQLEADNRRLRSLLELQSRDPQLVGAPVISREPGGWWQQLLIGKGSLDGLAAGDAVMGPGGLAGRVASVTPTTAWVQLLTDGGSRLGVWLPRLGRHALLHGVGTPRPLLRFLEKDPGARPGDLVVTSPASTLVPPNLAIGVIQTVDDRAIPATEAVVQLSAPVQMLDWVQVRTRER
ncbi:MAG: rod shape-determining protein MreC [Cyanobacteriota bacterium]|jgi:rod shape-determining protein MreC|nr:rod shape-determining protein MreC [Cyanobacteriota bacterium]